MVELTGDSGNVYLIPKDDGPHGLLKQALEALETHVPHYLKDRGYAPITAIREYLDNTKKQEPVAWMGVFNSNDIRDMRTVVHRHKESFKAESGVPDWVKPLYLHPAPIPPGMVLVPEEPTEVMIKAGNKWAGGVAYETYKAMLAAAKRGEQK